MGEGGGGLAALHSTKEMERLSSAFEKADMSAVYRPFSSFDKGIMNFHLRNPNNQLKNK